MTETPATFVDGGAGGVGAGAGLANIAAATEIKTRLITVPTKALEGDHQLTAPN
jgi:hypothetical protein